MSECSTLSFERFLDVHSLVHTSGSQPHIVPIGSAVGEVASLAGSGMRKNTIVSGTNPSLGVL